MAEDVLAGFATHERIQAVCTFIPGFLRTFPRGFPIRTIPRTQLVAPLEQPLVMVPPIVLRLIESSVQLEPMLWGIRSISDALRHVSKRREHGCHKCPCIIYLPNIDSANLNSGCFIRLFFSSTLINLYVI